jgi:hypothetical protein
MYLYIKPATLICPVCKAVMLASTNEAEKYCCSTPTCRIYRRWFQVDFPVITAHACSAPADTFLAEAPHVN